MDWTNLKEGLALIEEGRMKLARGPADSYINRLVDCYELLISRFSPYHVGDVVELAETPEISSDKSWGWRGAKHFLVEGARAQVVSVDCDGTGFWYGLQFERETWLDDQGVEHEKDEPSIYTFSEHQVRTGKPVAVNELPGQEVCSCPKCSGADIIRRWHRSSYDCSWDFRTRISDEKVGEHLHHICSSCGYEWRGTTKDQERAP